MFGRISRIASVATKSAQSAKLPSIGVKFNCSAARKPVAIRQFSTLDEPEYVVDPDALVDLTKVKVTYVKDMEKQQIYARFRQDPLKWSVKAISNFYSMSEDRVQAIIYLMHTRFTMMEEKGLKVTIVPHEDNPEEPINVEAILAAGEDITLPGPSVFVEIPEIWRHIFAMHKEEPEKDLGEILSTYNHNQAEEALKARMSVEELKKILENLKDHEARLENIRVYEEHIDNFLAELAEEGADINFQEIKVVSDKTKRFEKSYFPRTLHDEEIQTEKDMLLKRIEQQTRATVDRNTEFFHNTFAGQEVNAEAKSDAKEKAMRWKLAFRDLGKVDQIRAFLKDKSQVVDAPTLIRSRTGRMRTATPLEESFRSWTKKPTYIDRLFTESFEHLSSKYVKPFADIDGDDHLTAELGKEKQKEIRINAAKARANAEASGDKK
jgi:hypothetical protein